MATPGEIWLDSDFFGDKTKRKFFLILAIEQGDFVIRNLTSQQLGRPEEPCCYHGQPYQGYFLGVLGGALWTNSWLDLAMTEDLDAIDFDKLKRAGQLSKVTVLAQPDFCQALRCVATAPQTDKLQTKRIYNVIAALNCRP